MAALTRPGNAVSASSCGYSVAFLGDSILSSNHGTYQGGDSFADYAAMMSGGRLVNVGNYGIPGQRTDQMLARLPQALVDRPSFLVVLGGTNDVSQGVQAGLKNEQIVAGVRNYLGGLYAACKRAGTTPVACTVPPYGFTTGLNDQRQYANEWVNDWIRRHAALNGFPLIDFHALLVEPGIGSGGTATTGASGSAPGNWRYPPLTYTTDGTHPTAVSAGMMGQAVFNALAPLLPPVPFITPLLTVRDSAQSYSYIKNALWVTQSANPAVYPDQANTLGVSLATAAANNITYSMVSETGYPGFALQVARASGSAAAGIAPQLSTAVIPAGNIVQMSGYFTTDGNIDVQAYLTLGGNTYYAVKIAKGTAITHGMYLIEVAAPTTAALGAVGVIAGNSSTGAGTAKFWQPKVVDLTARFGTARPITAN